MSQSVSVRRLVLLACVVAVVATLVPTELWANTASGAQQLTGPLDRIKDLLLSVAKPLAIILIIIGGFTWAFSRHEEGMKKIGQAFVGIAIVLGATTLVNNFTFSAGLF